jgi:hypothetical protein
LLANPLASLLVVEVRIITLEQLVQFFDEEWVVLIRMGLQQGYFQLFHPVFVDEGKYLMNVCFIYEAFDDSELLVNKDLLMN